MGLAVLLLVVPLASSVLASPLRFDQRQNGSVNVQVDLKDLEVYAIMKDEQLEGAMVAQAADTVRPRPNAAVQAAAEAYESLKASAGAVASGDSPVTAAAASAAAASANVPRRPNDKLGSIKHKNGGLLPHERSDASPDMPPWESAAPAAPRGEESEDLDDELEPRATTTVEARAAPAAAAAASSAPIPAAAAVSPSGRPSQSLGVRPAGTVSVAHLHCGMGYYRDQSGRCRRSRRPSPSNTRKHHHHHGTRRHRPTAAPASPASAPKDIVKEVPNKDPAKEAAPGPLRDSLKDNKDSTSKDAATKDSPDPVKEHTKDAAAAPASAKEPVRKDSTSLPAVVPALSVVPGPAKVAVKEPTKAHPAKQAPVKVVAAKTPVTVQDRIAGSGNKVVSSVKQAAKPHAATGAGPVREVVAKPAAVPVAVQQQLRQPQRQPAKPAAPAQAKDKDQAPKVSHHHGQHKITVIKEDGKPRAPPAGSAGPKTVTKAAGPAPPAPPAPIPVPVLASGPAPALASAKRN
ncbi:hypothetical protein ONE63_005473 [Megalurothrips usitatus]|uniref:Uncharacterized protein n=1 Tax=Megalurothrips usitatus TaxID=439358 RepID=A0AAV7XZG6_9NEOP|nr:hypothetical protein ONE63_005473 [Megalurothrips usitatus]